VTECVLDASAVLAFLQEEPGQEAVAEVLAAGRGIISAMNLSEAAAKLADGGMTRALAEEALRALNLDVRPFDEPLALECAWLRESTREAGLSLGDRACLALGKRLSRPVLTTDRSWNGLAVGVTVQLARP
jgi:ribonuclease VapC